MTFSVIAQAVVGVVAAFVTTGFAFAFDVTFLASGLALDVAFVTTRLAFDVVFLTAGLSAGLFTNLTVTVL
jgi:hypothetical protein